MGRNVAVLVFSLVAAAATAAWPVTTTLLALIAAIVFAALRGAPALALAAAILFFGFEGSVKILLGLEPTPLPSGSRAAGAAMLDFTLLAAVAGVLARVSWRRLPSWWKQLARLERIVAGAFAVWLLLSVAQAFQGGDLQRGIEGLRLVQAYVPLAAAVAVAASMHRGRVADVALALGAVVSTYAALRVAIEPAVAEERNAIIAGSTYAYGDVIRAVGSFTSAVGLGSFLTPVAVFALVTAHQIPRLRWPAGAVAALALVGILGAYGRGPLVAMALGLVVALVVLGVSGDVARRRKLVAAGLVVGGLSVLSGGVVAAGQASPELRDRLGGAFDPLGDKSLSQRLDTWTDALEAAARNPVGRGVGTVGSASADDRAQLVTTDNSYLKVLVEQGIVGGGLFIVAVLGGAIVVIRRLMRAPPAERPLGLAALAAYAAFLGLAATGEYVEQPGKVMLWAALGVALATVAPRLGSPAAWPSPAVPDLDAARRYLARHGRILGISAALLVLVPAAVSLARDGEYASSTELRPVDDGAFVPQVPQPDILANPVVLYGMQSALTETATRFEDVRIRVAGPRIRVRVKATTPERARRFAQALGNQIIIASSGGAVPQGPMKVHRRATRPRISNAVDRAIDALPGELPGRPSPFWAAFAGLVVLTVGWTIASRLPRRWWRP